MIQLSNLSLSYGSRTLFEELTFSMIAGEKLGLVGRNGCGKSTIFKIILGEETPDEGTVTIPRGYRVGHLAQHLQFTEPTILKEACLGLPEHDRDQEYRGEIILNGLGFSEDDLQKPPSAFSGGFQIRINLAKLLLSEPNLLLLDEPTNYLDIVSMRWLTTFLKEWRDEIIIISHDRLFMDAITTHSMLIHRGKLRKIKGPTTKLYEQVLLDEEIYEKTRVNEGKKRKDLEEFVNRFRAQASKAALVQSRLKALERMGEKEELQDEQTLDFQFCEAPFPGKLIAEAREIKFSYPNGPELMGGLSVSIAKGDRIGVIGKNGKGKSTFLKLLSSEISPSSGSVSVNQNGRIGYFGQTNISRLSPKLTVEQEVAAANSQLHRTKVRAICGTMMFSGDDAEKKVSVLSGGEKSRVLLGKILAQPSNFLLLDEPTNHLDMESIEALVESLRNYEGAVVIVTHSELILRELATRLIVFQGDSPRLFEHDYAYFLEKEGWSDEAEMTSSQTSKPAAKKEDSTPIDPKVKREIESTEKQISKLEEKQRQVEASLAVACEKRDPGQIAGMTNRLQEIKSEIEARFAELEVLYSKVGG